MKSLKNFTTAVLLIVVVLFWSSCKKEVSNGTQPQASTENKNLHTRGAVADDPEKVERLSTIISSNYIQNLQNPEQSTSRRSKPGADGIPPTVSITSPGSGATVNGTVNVVISASDNVGVTSVSLTADNIIIGSTNLTPYTIAWNSGSAADGNHTLTAKATDAAGNSSVSSIIVTKNNSIIVLPPTNLPASYALTTPPIGF